MEHSEKIKSKTVTVAVYMWVATKEQLSPEGLKKYLAQTTEKPQKGEK